MIDSISIVCEGPRSSRQSATSRPHARPVRVVTFSGGLIGEDWLEVPIYSARRRAEAAEREREHPRAHDMDSWLAGTVGPDVPSIASHLFEVDGFGPRPTGALGSQRSVYAVKCPRCSSGRTRRAEKLWPLLDSLIARVPEVVIVGRPHRTLTLTILEFWDEADKYDRRAT